MAFVNEWYHIDARTGFWISEFLRMQVCIRHKDAALAYILGLTPVMYFKSKCQHNKKLFHPPKSRPHTITHPTSRNFRPQPHPHLLDVRMWTQGYCLSMCLAQRLKTKPGFWWLLRKLGTKTSQHLPTKMWPFKTPTRGIVQVQLT